MFPSPCGDKLKSEEMDDLYLAATFPSPCGDKLKYATIVNTQELYMFPSPCGDKLKFELDTAVTELKKGFRPLAGIS